MLQPNREYLSPTVLFMRNNFGPQQYLHKIHNIALLVQIFTQSEFPKGTEDDGCCPITQHLLDGQAVVHFKTVELMK